MRGLVKMGLLLLVGFATCEVASACCFESDVIEFFSCTNLKGKCFADTAKRGCNRSLPSDYQCHSIMVYCCNGGGQLYQSTDTSKPCLPHCNPTCLTTTAARRTKTKRNQAALLLSDDIRVALNSCQ